MPGSLGATGCTRATTAFGRVPSASSRPAAAFNGLARPRTRSCCSASAASRISSARLASRTCSPLTVARMPTLLAPPRGSEVSEQRENPRTGRTPLHPHQSEGLVPPSLIRRVREFRLSSRSTAALAAEVKWTRDKMPWQAIPFP